MKCVISPKFLYYFVAHVTENKEVQRQNFNVSNKLGLKKMLDLCGGMSRLF